jgi:hypothetical protein
MDADMYGMTVRGKTIYYCTKNNGLKMLSLSDKSVSDIINSERSTVKYVVTSGDKLYYTCYSTCTVRCCDLHGIAMPYMSASIEIVVLTFRLSISIIAMHILLSHPDDTATLLLTLISTASKVAAPVLSLPIWNIFSPSLLKKLTVLAL